MRISDWSSDVCSSDLLGTTILTTVGGNENLKPESSTTWTVGTVISPKGLITGLSLTADWFDIKIKDAIRAIPGSTKLGICYASQNLSHPFCEDFTRSALTGEVTRSEAHTSALQSLMRISYAV